MTQHSKLLCLAFLLLVICARGTWGHVRCLYNPPACTTKHYYYNASSHQCRSITASVNCTQRVSASQENAFNTLMECTELCVEGKTPPPPSNPTPSQGVPEHCFHPVNGGKGFGFYFRYWFNPKCNCCKRFTYHGHGGNDNRFSSEEECLRTCDPQHITEPQPISFHVHLTTPTPVTTHIVDSPTSTISDIHKQPLHTTSLATSSTSPSPSPSPFMVVDKQEERDNKPIDQTSGEGEGAFLYASVSVGVFVILFGAGSLVLIITMWWRHSQRIAQAKNLLRKVAITNTAELLHSSPAVTTVYASNVYCV